MIYHPESGFISFDIPLINCSFIYYHILPIKNWVSQTFISIFLLIPWGFPVFRSRKPHLWNANLPMAPDLDRLKTWLGHPGTWSKNHGEFHKNGGFIGIIAGQIIHKMWDFPAGPVWVLHLGFGSRPPCCTPLTGSTLASCRWKPCMWGAPRGLEGGHTGDLDTSWAWAKANLYTPSLTAFTPEMRWNEWNMNTQTWSDKNMSTKSLKWQIYVDHFGSEIKIYCKTAVVALDPLRQGCPSWLWTRAGRWKALWRMQPDCSQISQFIYWTYWAFGWCWMVMVCYGMLWYVMVCYGMLWYVMVCYGMLWYVMVICKLFQVHQPDIWVGTKETGYLRPQDPKARFSMARQRSSWRLLLVSSLGIVTDSIHCLSKSRVKWC